MFFVGHITPIWFRILRFPSGEGYLKPQSYLLGQTKSIYDINSLLDSQI